ncbi:MAG TPA: mannose-1-phosphate guanylyltransferase/mannose-6-phosphate isomerase [Hyphomicrobiaceae bacterium]|nr:mannose-1-phosphate guanylyltransferase/mannose-6-phosphate isomerase [Hyphomicrobiaceae bacterium]
MAGMSGRVVPVILSGGSGTRLWPLSRAMYPKQFIPSFNRLGTSFLGATLRRLSPQAGFEPALLVCNNDHRFLVKSEIERAGVTLRAVVLEPVARNTAPAIAVAALMVEREWPDAVIAVMPSDHVISNETRFADAVRQAASIAASGKLVLFGIEAKTPHTGYGYIRSGRPFMATGWATFEVAGFFEKPDRKTAERYVADGGYYWNSGIFVLNVRTFLEELSRLEPVLLEAVRASLAGAREDLGFLRLEAEAFARAPDISVDYAVMEKTSAAVVMPVDVGWSDIGSWATLWELAPRDEAGNFVHGDALMEDTRDCYVRSEKSLVATIGIEGLVIVDTPDALLVADRARTQEVSRIVERLRRSGRKEHAQHLVTHRPWGYFETLSVGPRFQVKLLHVDPGGKLSLQMHHHRSEHWVVVQGTARVVVGDREQLVRENESVYIVATQWHRLENPGKVPLQLIEVQIGTYLGEDDIVRSDDIYNRAPEETK